MTQIGPTMSQIFRVVVYFLGLVLTGFGQPARALTRFKNPRLPRPLDENYYSYKKETIPPRKGKGECAVQLGLILLKKMLLSHMTAWPQTSCYQPTTWYSQSTWHSAGHGYQAHATLLRVCTGSWNQPMTDGVECCAHGNKHVVGVQGVWFDCRASPFIEQHNPEQPYTTNPQTSTLFPP